MRLRHRQAAATPSVTRSLDADFEKVVAATTLAVSDRLRGIEDRVAATEASVGDQLGVAVNSIVATVRDSLGQMSARVAVLESGGETRGAAMATSARERVEGALRAALVASTLVYSVCAEPPLA